MKGTSNSGKKSNFDFKFKEEIPEGITNSQLTPPLTFPSVDKRIQESAKILVKYAERIPVVIEKGDNELTLPDLTQTK